MPSPSQLLLLSALLTGLSGLTYAQKRSSVPLEERVSASGATDASKPRESHVKSAEEGLEDTALAAGADAVPGADAANDAAATDPTVFVKGAALGGMMELELAKLALSKSQNSSIRSFAERMSRDHRKAHAELAGIARKKGFDVPTSLVTQDENIVKDAAGKSGAEFDAWFANRMVREHDSAVALYQSASRSTDGELAAFAKKTLPMLEEHLQMAKSLPGAPQ